MHLSTKRNRALLVSERTSAVVSVGCWIRQKAVPHNSHYRETAKWSWEVETKLPKLKDLCELCLKTEGGSDRDRA